MTRDKKLNEPESDDSTQRIKKNRIAREGKLNQAEPKKRIKPIQPRFMLIYADL